MVEFFQIAVSPLNLPFTILLGLVLFYWLFVMFGAVDFDWMPEIDLSGSETFDSLFEWLHIGDTPVMLVVSVIVVNLWSISIAGNYFFNPQGSLRVGLILLVVNVAVSFAVAAVFSRLFYRWVGPLSGDDHEDQKVLYRVGVVVTSEVNSRFGQVEIQVKGPPITVHARTMDEKVVFRGQKVLVFDEDIEKGVFFVEAYKEE